MISDDSQRALDIVMFVVAIIFSGIRIGLLFDLRRRSCHVTLAQYWGALLLLLASVMSIVVGVLDIVDMKNFSAKGNSVVGPEKLPYRMSKEPEQNHWVQTTLQVTALFCLKGSYLTIFWAAKGTISKSMMRGLRSCTALVVVCYIVSMMPHLAWCHPEPWVWDPKSLLHCNVFAIVPLTISFFPHIISDLCIVILASFFLRSMSASTKPGNVALVVVFGLAFTSIGAACARYAVYIQVDNSLALSSKNSSHLKFTADQAALATFWNKMELVLSITAYGVLSARALLRYLQRQAAVLRNRNHPRTDRDVQKGGSPWGLGSSRLDTLDTGEGNYSGVLTMVESGSGATGQSSQSLIDHRVQEV